MKIDAAQVVEDWQAAPAHSRQTVNARLGVPRSAVLTISAVNSWLEDQKEIDMDYNFDYKGTRPWDLVNVTSRLDPNQIWIGMEFETGFDDKERYDKAVNWLWNNATNFVIDREGSGVYPCEFTFSPVNLDQFMSKDYIIDKFLVKLNKIGEHERPDSEFPWEPVGMHVNFSGPLLRGMHYVDVQKVAAIMSSSIGALDDDDKEVLFDRTPYGYVYARGDVGNYWLEGKLFNSTHTPAKWQSYKNVSNNLALLAERIAGDKGLLNTIALGYDDRIDGDEGSSKIVENFMDIAMGEAAVNDASFIANDYVEDDEDDDYPF